MCFHYDDHCEHCEACPHYRCIRLSEGQRRVVRKKHISLSTFPPEQEKEANEIAGKTAASFAPVPVHISHIGIFAGGKILFAAPEKDAELTALQEACQSSAPQYPWTPHTTILIDEPETIHAALPVFVKSFVPFTARITRLHLCAFWPTREIGSFVLKGTV